MEKQKITSICQDCKKQYDYVLTPGYPRKYCPECSAKRKAAYDDMAKSEVVKPTGFVADEKAEMGFKAQYSKNSAYPKDPVGLAVEVFNVLVKPEMGDLDKQMTIAVKLVKQAQQAFS